MKAVEFINPEGEIVEVPESDAPHFDGIGWQRADGSDAKKPTTKHKNTK